MLKSKHNTHTLTYAWAPGECIPAGQNNWHECLSAVVRWSFLVSHAFTWWTYAVFKIKVHDEALNLTKPSTRAPPPPPYKPRSPLFVEIQCSRTQERSHTTIQMDFSQSPASNFTAGLCLVRHYVRGGKCHKWVVAWVVVVGRIIIWNGLIVWWSWRCGCCDMTNSNSHVNGASLEDCHTNFFALVRISLSQPARILCLRKSCTSDVTYHTCKRWH